MELTPDYYEILQVSRNASALAIKRAYRRAALKSHPDKRDNHDNGEVHSFHEIQKAFDVLSNPQARLRYDADWGAPDAEELVRAACSGPVTRENWPDHFDSVLSKSNGPPAADDEFVKGHTGNFEPAPRDLEQIISCSLEELYLGAQKRVSLQLSSKAIETEIQIQPGFRHGTRLTFKESDFVKRGRNDGPTEPTAKHTLDRTNVVLVLVESAHAYYRRDGDDLICTAAVPLCKALIGFTIYLQHLDGREISIETAGPVTPGMVTTLAGEGMPVRYKGDVVGVGNLRVQFDVQFPIHLKPRQKEDLARIFDDNANHHRLGSADHSVRTQALNSDTRLHATSFTITKRTLRRNASCPYPYPSPKKVGTKLGEIVCQNLESGVLEENFMREREKGNFQAQFPRSVQHPLPECGK